MEIPQGKLLAIGGAEDKGVDLEKGKIIRDNLNFFELGILRRLVQEAGGTHKEIEVITTASSTPAEVGDNYLNAFGKIGCTNVSIIPIRDRPEVDNPEYLDRIRNCNAVMFSGGNQLRLSSIFGGTEFLSVLLTRLENDRDFIIGGTSAGAMAMSNTMIYEGNASTAHLKGEVKLTTGLGFMKDVVFDSHFEKRGRFVRLAQAIISNPSTIGIGLGEDTGMLIREGNIMEAVGSGLVVILDGHEIKYSNIADIPDGNPLSMDDLKVHFCAKGSGYLVKERRFIPDMATYLEKNYSKDSEKVSNKK